MLFVITGTRKSGKSQYAEALACRLRQGKKLYIATMEPADEAGHARIARHREMRAGKGFETLEYYGAFRDFPPPPGFKVVLLECVSNLLANEMFSPYGAGEDWMRSILTGFDRLRDAVETVIAVTNAFSAEGEAYDADTMRYIRNMEELNGVLVRRADAVLQVVAGRPVWTKGDGPCFF